MQSSFPIPELAPIEMKWEQGSDPDVLIAFGEVPFHLENPLKRGVRIEVEPGRFLFTAKGIARYSVADGRYIHIQTEPSASQRDVRVFLLGSVMGAMLHQRGILPMHASAVAVDDRCAVFCGASGSGKSTLSRGMVKRGFSFHADDLCVLKRTAGDGYTSPHGIPVARLWEDSLVELEDDPRRFDRIRKSPRKYYVPVSVQFNRVPIPVGKLYILAPHNRDTIELVPLDGYEKFNMLRAQVYKNRFVKFMGTGRAHFQNLSHLSEEVGVTLVKRPTGSFRLAELIDTLLGDFRR